MIVRLLAVLAVVSVVTAGVTGWFWWNSAEADLASTRDAVLADGQRHAIELNTMDYRSPDLDRWRNAATGPLLDRLTHNQDSDKTNAINTKTISTARIVTSAVTTLNTHTGTANMIAAVEITLSQNGTPPTPKVSRLDVDLTKTGGDWKVSALEVVGT
jgi:Mce-associated membrane protein